MVEKKNWKEKKVLHICIIIFMIIIVLTIAGIIMLKYQVEGEKNLPFIISKIIVVSTAEGKDTGATDTKWNIDIDQNNDIYVSINKEEDYNRSEIIKNVTFANFALIETPKIGTVKLYRPANDGLFKAEEAYEIKEKIEYKGSKAANLNNLEIANQGGTIAFRYTNQKIGTYKTDEEIINHDGTLIAKAGIPEEQIKMKVSFDIIIETGKGIKYKGTINLELPIGKMEQEGTGTFEKTDFSDVVFKRI